jgi:hypothetical protein
MIECGYANFKETWWIPVVKEGLDIPALVFELKDRLPWLAIMEKDDKGTLVDVSKLYVCSPVPPHHRLPATTRVRPGDAVVLKRTKVPCSLETSFVSKAVEATGDGEDGKTTPSQRPGREPVRVVGTAPEAGIVFNVYIEWTTTRDEGTNTWTSWFVYDFPDSIPARVMYQRVSDVHGVVAERFAVLQAQALAQALRALMPGPDMWMRIHIPSTFAVAMAAGQDLRSQVVFWVPDLGPSHILGDVHIPTHSYTPAHARTLRSRLVAFVKLATQSK